MCGICGVTGIRDLEIIRKMTAIQSHRGPDDQGTYVSGNDGIALGHTRLSIIDLSPRGHQPMGDSQGRLWLTYNGEIYNYAELREELSGRGYDFQSKTDTEVVLYSFLEWGPECVRRFNGMFAFAIWDSRDKLLFLARDPLGVKPLYYYHDGSVLIFASEIKAILESQLVERLPDYTALHTPSMFQASPFTGFKNILKLPPGSHMTFRDGRVRMTRYWQVSPSEEYIRDESAIEQLDHLLRLSVRGQMISDVPVGALLIGGLDSSLIVALMAKTTGQKINTFTIRYSDDDQRFERMPRDSDYARIVADVFACSHQEILIDSNVVDLLPKIMWHLDEPLADPASINTYLIARSAREKGVTVLLNGMGGDEIFGGYRKYLACILADSYQAFLPEVARTGVQRIVDRLPVAATTRGIRTVRWAKRFTSFASLPQAERFFGAGFMSSRDFGLLFTKDMRNNHDFWNNHFTQYQRQHFERDDLSYLTKMCLCDTGCYLPDHNLTYSDKCTMALGVESRPPLTDHRVVEFMFRLRPGLRIKGLTQKYLLKKVAERYLPRGIVYRPKAPFGAPLRSWIRGPLKEMIDDYLSPQSLRRRNIYDSDFVWRKIQNDRNGIEDNAHLIWTCLCTEVWLRQFFR
jgi:asparagine synthase (glutamine-hydrolysing)